MSLNGRLEDLDLSDIFQILSLSKRSGVLTIIRRDTTGRLVFKEGLLLYGSSDGVNKIGYNLVKKKMLTNDELEKALESQKTSEKQIPLGSILLKTGAISKEDLQTELKSHLTDVVKNFLGWETGSFHFNVQEIADQDPLFDKGLNLDFVLMEATRQRDEDGRAQIEEESHQDNKQEEDEEIQFGDFLEGPLLSEVLSVSSTNGSNARSERNEAHQETLLAQATSTKGSALLTSMIEEISRPATTGEITLMVIRYAAEIMNRVVIFLAKKDTIIGSGQSGFSFKEGSADQIIRQLNISRSNPSLFQEVIEKRTCYRGELPDNAQHQNFIAHIGGQWPKEVFLAPLFKGEQLSAFLYGDNLPEQSLIGDTDGLEAFLKVAGFAFGKEGAVNGLVKNNQAMQ